MGSYRFARHFSKDLRCVAGDWSFVGVKVGVVSESSPGERRVAMVPGAISVLAKTGAEFMMEAGAGRDAGYPDAEYAQKGVRLGSREDVFAIADVVLQVRSPGANPETGRSDLAMFRRGQTVIGFGEPLTAIDTAGGGARGRGGVLQVGGGAPAQPGPPKE